MHHSPARNLTHKGEARLYINGEPVGGVLVQRVDPSWSYGRFRPDEAFATYAPLIGRWSLLMHAGGQYERLTSEVGDKLRRAEFEIDRLHAEIHLLDGDERVTCSQLNIDGSMIEWKSS
jgi:hypothetical protein